MLIKAHIMSIQRNKQSYKTKKLITKNINNNIDIMTISITLYRLHKDFKFMFDGTYDYHLHVTLLVIELLDHNKIDRYKKY